MYSSFFITSPIGVLGTSRFYRIQGQLYAFTPHFMYNNEFYINSDPNYLVSEFESELSFTKKNWFYPGRPTIVVLLSHELVGTNRTTSGNDASKKNLLNFFTTLRGGYCGGIRVRLSRLSETINTSNIESLDFLVNKPDIDWQQIIRSAHLSKTYKKRLAYDKSKTQASTPGGGASGGRTPKRKNTTFYGNSLASTLDKLNDESYFNELANALSKLKADSEPQFKLKAHENSPTLPNRRPAPTTESPSEMDSSIINKTGSVPLHQDQSSSPHEMLSLTLGDDAQFDQAVESLAASVNLYDQIGK
jgi:phosphorylase kinase alpha/beta subunit